MSKIIGFISGLLAMVGVASAQFAPTPVNIAPSAPANMSQANTQAKAGSVDFAADLDAVTTQLKAKFDAGKTNEADLKENMEAIHALLVQHSVDGKRDQVARLYLLDAHIFVDALNSPAKARAIWVQVLRSFPGTPAANGAAILIARLDAKLAADAGPNVPEGLEIGQKFPGFNETDIAGRQLAVADHKGRVTMIDFWATWCPPCREEMPNVVATYQRYNAQGFDIIGVSLDSDKDAVASFTQGHAMAWPQYFDGQGWDNKLAKKYGVQSIPMDYLLDRRGVIIGKELRGEDLPAAVAKALAASN